MASVVIPISIQTYFQQYAHGVLIDVRSPAEYAHAHIPGAQSLPLFLNDERKEVGTAYKQISREQAIKIGLKYFGPKMVGMIEQVEQWCQTKQEQTLKAGPTHIADSIPVVVHCWRGGMRSAGVAWLLSLYGFQVYSIQGGYKSFRQWCLQQFALPYPLAVVGGYTGSGKTAILHQLRQLGRPMVDLEHLAGHKGSAFGNINLPPQPSQEMFENKLALALQQAALAAATMAVPQVWVEDESQRIGLVNIPASLFATMRKAPLVFLNIPFEQRLNYLVKDYGKGEIEKLVNAIIRIQKRLGGLAAKAAIQCLLESDIRGCFTILLQYYDKGYLKGLHNHQQTIEHQLLTLELPTTQAVGNAQQLLEYWDATKTIK